MQPFLQKQDLAANAENLGSSPYFMLAKGAEPFWLNLFQVHLNLIPTLEKSAQS